MIKKNDKKEKPEQAAGLAICVPCLSADHILGVARDCPNGEAFAMRIVPAPMAHDAMVSLATAEDRLGELESRWCEVAA